MDRQADQSIKGFIYQFLTTIKVILTSSDDQVITCEGIEDIDISEGEEIEAIQCKYHESVAKFRLSNVYKPLLQMMNHFVKNPPMKIKYNLYSYFPNEQFGIKKITRKECEEILSSKNKSYKLLIGGVKGIDIDSFLKKFYFHIGYRYEDLLTHIKELIVQEGFSQVEVDSLILPNLLYYISELSIKKDEKERMTTKNKLFLMARNEKKLLINKWMEELKEFDVLIKNKRAMLHDNLNSHLRRRAFIFNQILSENTDHLISFINDLIKRYYSSDLDKYEPLICVNLSDDKFKEIRKNLFHNGLIGWDGCIADEFIPARFIQSPPIATIEKKIIKKHFQFKIINRKNIDVINWLTPFDDYYIFDNDIAELVINQAKKEIINFNNFGYISYIFQLRKGYERVN